MYETSALEFANIVLREVDLGLRHVVFLILDFMKRQGLKASSVSFLSPFLTSF